MADQKFTREKCIEDIAKAIGGVRKQKKWNDLLIEAEAALDAIPMFDELEKTRKKNNQLRAAFYLAAEELIWTSNESDDPAFVAYNWVAGCDFKEVTLYLANVNDTFNYGADAEELTFDEIECLYLDIQAKYKEKPWIPVVLLVQKKRGGIPFIPRIKDMIDEFHKSKGIVL